MTIQIQGYVSATNSMGCPSGKIQVSIGCDSNAVGHSGSIVLYVPKKDAAHWHVGRSVNMTAYAFDAENSGGETGEKIG